MIFVKIKGFEHERSQDAPFMGCLVIANDCRNNCRNCFNQHLKNKPSIDISVEDVIAEVKSNPFNQGVIFGGLEWYNQKDDLYKLMRAAADAGLKIMVYTGKTTIDDKMIFEECAKKVDTYLKLGPYIDNLPSTVMYGITLASNNQSIIKF